ncbi:hypothetical protein Htur_4781 (plasmid) [Haloterrigena turkmenica DSM 5511]|uniref:Uncharacterized protein n=1 Tax=Haloterrigena turkmenica (strain ATCC 51198 / DSM 5511 / JCM 9101 / NCIMB 13204 / VKM B-1734 / 4k) TaxID=543526 RepID=D2S2F6_HALTV|nr:hypothetical protein [Haloterrigena turkmenica]ADB63553.1 hypothetical protein Htur_4781 [Haloterrigena turkmenica DSM 5511]
MYEIRASDTFRRPPEWATLQRDLFETMADAVDGFVDEYLAENGEPYWPPDDHVGVDGFDDVIEGFYNWPLVYAMGGDERFLERSQEAYEGALKRGSETETPFGHPMVVDEFEQCRDWFHLGEGNLFTYNMGLAAPDDETVVDRAERFAGLYFDDADVNNYDGEKRLVRAPQNGSMGPEYSDLSAFGDQSTFGGYGSDYRWATHGLPWRDTEFDEAAELLDPDNEDRLYEIYGERCSRGDIPLNLGITSLMTNAYLHTGDDRYREWVTDYLQAWRERTAENGGIIPDNVGLSGEIGEYTNGKWYGGFYGWSWGGWHYVGIGPTVAAENAVLLEGDREYLEFPRSQLDVLIENGIEVSEDPIHDTLYVPHKYGDPGDYHYNASGVLTENDGEVLWRDGWYEFKPHRDDPYVFHLWYMSLAEEDRERVDRLRDWGSRDWKQVDFRASNKHGAGEEYAWLSYLDGDFPAYPERIMEANHAHVRDHLTLMREEGGVPESEDLDEDYLRDRNPVFHRGLLQLTMGAPQPVYYGGLVMAQVRHFDPEHERPGLPPGVSALVEDVSSEGVDLTLVNGGGADRKVVVQAGAYGEHEFTAVEYDGERGQPESNAIRVSLPSGSRLSLSADLDRFANDPSYAFPWNESHTPASE